MKRIICLLCLLMLLVSGCGSKEDIPEVPMIVGQSLRFTEEEIYDAMNVVLDYFDENFLECTMTRMEYIESRSWVKAIEWAQRYDADEAIILFSDFEVSEDSTNYSLGPGTLHSDWTWILTRNEGCEWVLQSWGYAP